MTLDLRLEFWLTLTETDSCNQQDKGNVIEHDLIGWRLRYYLIFKVIGLLFKCQRQWVFSSERVPEICLWILTGFTASAWQGVRHCCMSPLRTCFRAASYNIDNKTWAESTIKSTLNIVKPYNELIWVLRTMVSGFILLKRSHIVYFWRKRPSCHWHFR